ncbi:extracellular catalytic domain type 1 short-chain-length polyhydroxyalkanoate depolymerase [Arenibacterium halophilum]|uniref:PHB depolymerase family esterase n=1 Tax=Arenibacterium halophilum TaxID=2583821 RepID=A0ABY2WX79_9RHOB|nr:PHB depolymerase family esterase [Arenibacterium halophilum]TMV07416.1 PHB depolymerase family esterase [Arenibacterium halophilum]
MFDFNAGAWRPVTHDARAKRLTDAHELVQRTLAQHGLGPSASPSSLPDPQGLMNLLQRMRAPRGDATAAGPGTSRVELPDGAQFLSDTYQGKSGTRAYRTYVPASAAGGTTALVMMLHGCTQTPEDFAIGTGMNALAERHGFIVLYPEQSRGANAQTCWNWFSPNDQLRDRGEPEILAGMARDAMTRYGVSPERCFVAGLSAGAAMAVILGATYPDVFAAAGAHSGLPYGSAKDVASAFAAMAGQRLGQQDAPAQAGVRTIVFHGTADGTVDASNGDTIARDAERGAPSPSLQTTRTGEENGRTYTATMTTGPDGRDYLEHWVIDGLGHAWSGGGPGGSYTDPRGPDASAEMIRFFLEPKDLQT